MWSDGGRARASETSLSSVSVSGGHRLNKDVDESGEAGVGSLSEVGDRTGWWGGERPVWGSGESRRGGVSSRWRGGEGGEVALWRMLASMRLWICGRHASTCVGVNGGAIMRYWDR